MRNVQQSLMVVVAVCFTLGYWIVDTRLRRAKGIRVPKRCPNSTSGPEHGEAEFGGDGQGPRALVDRTSPEWARRSFLDESEIAPGPKSATSITAEPGKSQSTSASDITPANELKAEIEKLRAENNTSSMTAAYGHMKTLKTPEQLAAEARLAAAAPPAKPPVTPSDQAAIINLANNDDLDVATIARQAHEQVSSDSGEVVISLH